MRSARSSRPLSQPSPPPSPEPAYDPRSACCSVAEPGETECVGAPDPGREVLAAWEPVPVPESAGFVTPGPVVPSVTCGALDGTPTTTDGWSGTKTVVAG